MHGALRLRPVCGADHPWPGLRGESGSSREGPPRSATSWAAEGRIPAVFSTLWTGAALLGPGNLRERLRRYLLDVKRFFDTTATPERLDLPLGHKKACRSRRAPD
jgi:hypothetical protein